MPSKLFGCLRKNIIYNKNVVTHVGRHHIRSASTKPSYYHRTSEDPLKAMSMSDLVNSAAEKYGDREAVIAREQNKRLTYWEVREEADKIAVGLLNLGFKQGDRLGIWAPNLIEWYLTMMAAARANLVLVALNPAYLQSEIEYCINKVELKGIVSPATFRKQNYYNMLRGLAPELEVCKPGELTSERLPSLKSVVLISDEKFEGALRLEDVSNFSSRDAIEKVKNEKNTKYDDICHVQFTSGTTGKPKAAAITHHGLVNNSYFIGKRNELNRKHYKACVQVPFFHVYGVDIVICTGLHWGTTLVLPSIGYSPEHHLKAIEEENCTLVYGTPTMYVDLVSEQNIRRRKVSPEIIVSGGALFSPHLVRQTKDLLGVKKIKHVYGLTETTAVVFQTNINDNEQSTIDSVGCVLDHTEVKVVDTEGNTVPCGVPGELYIRGYCNFVGYWNDEQKTKETNAEGRWLKTGDQFVLDENGYGKVVGRLKDMIIRGGENIAPKEIEDLLNTHPSILEAQIVSVPDERLGEEVFACVRLREGKTITKEDIAAFLKGKLAHFKIPKYVQIFDSFPRTASGKIQKFKLQEMVAKESSQTSRRDAKKVC